MQLAAARIVAVIVKTSVFAPVAEAAVIRGSATFEVEWLGDEEQGKFDPPLLGSGSFEIRSRPYDPDDVSEVFDFEVLDFSYSFAGASWDEADLISGATVAFSPPTVSRTLSDSISITATLGGASSGAGMASWAVPSV